MRQMPRTSKILRMGVLGLLATVLSIQAWATTIFDMECENDSTYTYWCDGPSRSCEGFCARSPSVPGLPDTCEPVWCSDGCE